MVLELHILTAICQHMLLSNVCTIRKKWYWSYTYLLQYVNICFYPMFVPSGRNGTGATHTYCNMSTYASIQYLYHQEEMVLELHIQYTHNVISQHTVCRHPMHLHRAQYIFWQDARVATVLYSCLPDGILQEFQ
jgi:hypothetical protein